MANVKEEKNGLRLFLLEAKKNTYAGYGKEVETDNPFIHKFIFNKDEYTYWDTYVGGEKFHGEEFIFKKDTPTFTMNYSGRVLEKEFSGDFLKEALRNGTIEEPYRGPRLYHGGDYIYTSKVIGDITWFQGYEEIYYGDKKVYECFYYGGEVL